MVWPWSPAPPPAPSLVDINPDSVDFQFEVRPPDPANPRTFQRLIVACDGTWQRDEKLTRAHDSDPDPSNVSRFYYSLSLSTPENDNPILLTDGSTVRQRALYIPGIGTSGLLDKYLGGAFGLGIEENIYSGYKWLCDNYKPNDEIFLIGFSRGAYTARSLAGFIQDVGLLRAENEGEFRKIFSEIFHAYKTPGPWNGTAEERAKAREAAFRRYMETRGYSYPLYFNIPIMGIGVWDTVGALGIPVRKGGLVEWTRAKLHWDMNWKYEFFNTCLDLGVQNAFHAIALDEQRYAYRPTMWYLPGHVDPIPAELFNPKNGEHLRIRALASTASKPKAFTQCWFPGVHIDIGGGSDSGLYPAFSDLTLLWMVEQFRSGKLLEFDQKTIEKTLQDAWNRKPSTPSRSSPTTGSEPPPPLPPPPPPPPPPAAAPADGDSPGSKPSLPGRMSQWVQEHISSVKGSITVLCGMVPRTPGIWTDFEYPPKEDQPNAAWAKEEHIHAILRLRKENGVPLPKSLMGFEYDSTNSGGSWYKKGDEAASATARDAVDIRIPEYVPVEGSAEFRLIVGDGPKEDRPLFAWWAPVGTAKGYLKELEVEGRLVRRTVE